MAKNIIVLDENGNRVSETYPKRAKGLVKSGRAEYIDDCTIRMNTQDPIVLDSLNTEDLIMGERINFNTREFKFDKTNWGENVGTRMFVTDTFGKTQEVFEIGADYGNQTQIACEKILEKNTDYVFRFGMSRKTSAGDSQLIIIPHKDEEANQDDWDNRYVFNLSKGEYKPSLTKVIDGKTVRIYEIPFNTDDDERFRFVFVERGSVSRIFPVEELEAYKDFPDGNKSFIDDTKAQFDNIFPKDFDMGHTINEASNGIRIVFDKAINAAKNAFGSYENNGSSSGKYYGSNMNADELCKIISSMGDGSRLSMYGCNLGNSGTDVDPGEAAADFKLSAYGCNIGGQSFACFTEKMGDGSELNFAGANIGSYDAGNVISHSGPADGVNVNLKGSVISESSFAKLLSKVADGSKIDISTAVINATDGEFYYGEKADGLVIDATNTVLPEKIVQKIYQKFGDGCSMNR